MDEFLGQPSLADPHDVSISHPPREYHCSEFMAQPSLSKTCDVSMSHPPLVDPRGGCLSDATKNINKNIRYKEFKIFHDKYILLKANKILSSLGFF